MDKLKPQDAQMTQEPSLIDHRPKDVIEKQRQQMKRFIVETKARTDAGVHVRDAERRAAMRHTPWLLAAALFALLMDPLLHAQTSFTPITPCRVADTRNPTGPFGGPMLTGGTARVFAIPSSPCMGGVTGASAYALNVTVVPQGPLAYLTMWPTDVVPMPVVSTLNSFQGQIVANFAVVKASQIDGSISVFATSATDLILDIVGYYGPLSFQLPGASISALSYTRLAAEVDGNPYNTAGVAMGPFKVAGITGTGMIYLWSTGAAQLTAGFYGTAQATLTGLTNGGVVNDFPYQSQRVATITSMQGGVSVSPWVTVR
jgi:hypothetical protein